ncbi:MAG: hypothetical protein ACKO40_05800 [Planctomycetaceae bacterium]
MKLKKGHLTIASLHLAPVSVHEAFAATSAPRVTNWPEGLVADVGFVAEMIVESHLYLLAPAGAPPHHVDAARLKLIVEQAVASGFALCLRRYGQELMANDEAASILGRQAAGRRKAQESLKAKGSATRAKCEAAEKSLKERGMRPTPKAIAKAAGVSIGHYYRLFPAGRRPPARKSR